jgi:hypothetical protein
VRLKKECIEHKICVSFCSATFIPDIFTPIKILWNQDVRLLRDSNWRSLPLITEEWKKHLRKVRAHRGLSSQLRVKKE